MINIIEKLQFEMNALEDQIEQLDLIIVRTSGVADFLKERLEALRYERAREEFKDVMFEINEIDSKHVLEQGALPTDTAEKDAEVRRIAARYNVQLGKERK